MKRLLWKILLGKQGKWQLVVAGAGFAVGLFILLVSVQLYTDLQHMLMEQESRESQSSYLLINKQVSLLNTFDKTVSGFSDTELDTIKLQDFIEDVGEFHTNQFRIIADLTMQIGFSTDLFFEAVNEKFIDKTPDEFNWDESSGFVPVIVSTEFLNLYNFGYSMTQSLPQLPADAVKMIPFNVTISGNGKSRKLSARVVGFSERIPSVLVPLEFMNWANSEYGSGRKPSSRIIIEVKDPGDQRLRKFLDEKRYVANAEQMKFQKAGTILKTIVSIIAGTGMLFVMLSVVIFVLNFQLILSRAKQEVEILLNLGYTKSSISSLLNLQLVVVLLFVLAIALAGQLFAIQKIHSFFSQNGFDLVADREMPLFFGAGITLAMLLVNSVSLRLSLR